MDGGVLTQLEGARQAIRRFISQYTAVRLVLVMVYPIRIKIF
jgi:ribosomal protein L16/L10AE